MKLQERQNEWVLKRVSGTEQITILDQGTDEEEEDGY